MTKRLNGSAKRLPTKVQRVELGARMLAFGVFALCSHGLLALLCVLLPFVSIGMRSPVVGFKAKIEDLFSTKGLDDDQKDLVRTLNKLVNEIEIDETLLTKAGYIKQEDVKKQIDACTKGLFTDDGKFAFDLDKLKQMLGDDEKGITEILKKLDANIKAMKEEHTKKAFGKFEDIFLKKMPEMEKVFKAGVGSYEFSIKAATIMEAADAVTGNEDLPADFIESFSVGAFVPKRFSREYVFDIASRTTVSEVKETKIWLEEGTLEGGFAVVAEGGLKPLISGNVVRNFSTAQKVAAKYRYTEEFAKFRKEAFTLIKRMINQKLLRDYNAILTTILLADAAPYVGSALDGTVAAALVTDYHAIAAVAAQIESVNFVPDALVMNPQDKWRIGMSQDTSGAFYLQVPMTDPTGNTRLMGFILRTSNLVPVGTFILGESGLFEIEDETITVRTGYGVAVTGGTSNGGGNVTDVQSDLDHNRFTVVVETFFHAYIASNNEGSYVVAEFADVKDAVTA